MENDNLFRERCRELENLGFTLLIEAVPIDQYTEKSPGFFEPKTVGESLDELLTNEFGRKEYAIVPTTTSGPPYRIYTKQVID